MTYSSRLGRYCAFCFVLLSTLPVHGNEQFGDVLHHLFVTHPADSLITVVDTRDDTVVGTLDAGLVPLQMEATGDLAKLVAIDGKTPRVNLLELTSGRHQSVALDFVPKRVVINPSGLVAAVFSPDEGFLAVVDLLYQTVLGPTRQITKVNDVLFDRYGHTLYLADDKGIYRVDVASGRRLGRIGPSGKVIRLAPSVTSRLLYATSADGTISAVNIAPSAERGKPLRISAGTGVARAYTNATGTLLFLPDAKNRQIHLVSPTSFKILSTVPATADVARVYSAWFDTIAFAPSATGLLVYDQEQRTREPDIPIPASSGRGTVTPDGRKFYLPIADERSLLVIDAAERRIAKRIPLELPPGVALMAVTFGICH